MSHVEFSDEEALPPTRGSGAKSGMPTGLMGLVVKIGLARNARGASAVLLIAALIAAAAAIGIFLSTPL